MLATQQTRLAFNHPISDENIVDYIIEEEDRRSILNCMVACLFARNVYTNSTESRPLSVRDRENRRRIERTRPGYFQEKIRTEKEVRLQVRKPHSPEKVFKTASTTGKIEEERVRRSNRTVPREKRGVSFQKAIHPKTR